MRRKDREISDINEILDIINRCDVCRLALSENDIPYIIPMNYGYEYLDGVLTLYFHCAAEGRKLDIIQKNPAACFETDCSHKLVTADAACGYSMRYESVVGTGVISICNDKEKALQLIMKKYAPDRDFSFTAAQTAGVVALMLHVKEITGKRSLTL